MLFTPLTTSALSFTQHLHNAAMSEKRKRDHNDGDAKAERKKQKKGFRVGPDNLPDGVWKRKSESASSRSACA